MADAARVVFINRYPVKGFSGEALDSVTLVKDRPFPGDRLFAIENGPSGYDPENPQFQPKFKYLVLMRNPRLAALATVYDHASGVMQIKQEGKVVAMGDLGTPEGRATIEAFFTTFMPDELRGPPKVLTGTQGYQFMDSAKSGFVSFLNLASVRALAAHAGREALDTGRFRMNIGLEGLPPWGEFDLVGKVLRVGAARVKILKSTERCAAINVAPGRSARDVDLIRVMEQSLDHHDCGIYGQIIEGGTVRLGDDLTVEQGALL